MESLGFKGMDEKVLKTGGQNGDQWILVSKYGDRWILDGLEEAIFSGFTQTVTSPYK